MQRRTLWERELPTRAGRSVAKLISPFIRRKLSLASPHVLAVKTRTTPLGNALQVLHPRLGRTTRRPATLPALVPVKRQGERTAAGKEAAGAQAVKRGHTVTMIEIPDPDDDTAYRQWLKRDCPTVSLKRESAAVLSPPDSPNTTRRSPNEGVGPTCEVTSPTVAASSTTSAKVKEAPHRWFRPFEVDWTLRAVCEARNDNAARAALAVWIHKDKGASLTDELLAELRLGGENARERLYELRDPPVIVQAHESSTTNFMVDIVLNPSNRSTDPEHQRATR